jgi:hypothetical protein
MSGWSTNLRPGVVSCPPQDAPTGADPFAWQTVQVEQKATAAIRRAAARNNAGWCATVCRSHGIASTVTDAAWYSLGRTPPYYPDAVTLRPDATPAHFLDRIDATSPGCSVKDSFATLDLTPDGFAELFTAQWIHRSAHLPAPPTPVLTVRRVSTAAELHDWQVAWHGDDSRSTSSDRPC